jgi:hypothetical protein
MHGQGGKALFLKFAFDFALLSVTNPALRVTFLRKISPDQIKNSVGVPEYNLLY